MKLTTGSRIDGYEIDCHAAMGATSDVYQGHDVQSGDHVAVKVLHDEWCIHVDIVKRFLNEAHALQGIDHPRLVKIFKRGSLINGPPYMILDWLPINLAQVIDHAKGPLAVHAALRIASQIAEGLVVLHDHGVIHRDLKPANVLLTDETLHLADVKLADLGLAKLLRDGTVANQGMLPISTGGSVVFGTYDYMAPEQWIQSKTVDAKVDVYALGVLLFQMLAGQLPFVAQIQKDLMLLHLFEDPPLSLLDHVKKPALTDLIAHMLGKKPNPRPTMYDVIQHLGNML